MPTKGKCWSCGEERYLTGQLLQHMSDGHWEYHMICQTCKDYFYTLSGKADWNNRRTKDENH